MSDLLELIKERNISGIIGNYTKIKQISPNQWKGLCPFHKEKTPSFTVNDKDGYFKCFGCGEGGDAVSFLMKIKNIDFQAALDDICNFFNIIRIDSHKNNNNIKDVSILTKMNDLSEKWHKNIHNFPNIINYLQKKRNLSIETINYFKIGFCSSDDIDKNDKINQKLGLYSKNGYLLMLNRITFPICDKKGNVIAFGGRVADNSLPKYINTAENEYFKKSDILFNIHNAIKNKERSNNFIIVEGYLDVITAYQNGIKTAIAPLGTSITESHIEQILKYDKSPIFAFDADDAGFNASTKAMFMLLPHIEAGILPMFFLLQNAKDLDELCNISSVKIDYKWIKQNSVEMQDYIVRYLLKKYDIYNPNTFASAIKEMDEILNKIKNNVIQNQYKFHIKNALYEKLRNKNRNTHGNLNINKVKDRHYNADLKTIEANIIKFIKENKNCIDLSILENYTHVIDREFYNQILDIDNQDSKNIDCQISIKLESMLIEIEFYALKQQEKHLPAQVFRYEKKNILEKKKNLLNKVIDDED